MTRPVRVTFPVQVVFAGESFAINEFTANLSVGGIFLPTVTVVPPGTRGSLTFRISQWEEPFIVQAEVVRNVPPGLASVDQPPGLGIQFIDLTPLDARRFGRLVDGIQDGSVAQAIRRTIREGGRGLLQELRERPTDQKVIFAFCAQGEEIDALVRDGHPTVILRLMDNPRLSIVNVRNMLRDPRLPTRVLKSIHDARRWLADEESRYLFCIHPNAPLEIVGRLLPQLNRQKLLTMERNANLRVQVRMKVKLALSQKR